MSEETSPQTLPSREEKRFRKTVRRKVVIEEEVPDRPNPEDYAPVTFRFYNELQRDVPIFYEWIDKWTKINECKGYLYDGGIYTLPRIVYEYLKNKCGVPVYANIEQEICPGQRAMVAKPISFKHHYRLDIVNSAA